VFFSLMGRETPNKNYYKNDCPAHL
jgi:hypothetical protein